MSRLDDPIFDPWSLGDEGWSAPQRASRWRGAANRDQGGVPLPRPIPGRHPSAGDESDEFIDGRDATRPETPRAPGPSSVPPAEPRSSRTPVDGVLEIHALAPQGENTSDAVGGPSTLEAPGGFDEPADHTDPIRAPGFRSRPNPPPAALQGPSLIELTDELQRHPRSAHRRGQADPQAPARIPHVSARTEPSPPPRRAGTGEGVAEADVLRALVLPRLERLGRRLTAGRHQTSLELRLGQSPPSVRFRIEPRPGPFDFRDHPGVVLEVLHDGGPEGVVIGRFWLDPNSEMPTDRRGVPADEATGTWLDDLLLDFVRRALG